MCATFYTKKKKSWGNTKILKMDFLQIYMTLYLIFNDVIMPDETVSWGGEKRS